MATITHARAVFGEDLAAHTRRMKEQARQFGVDVPALDDLARVADVVPLMARVEHGRWIVDCPDCKGAGFAWEDERLFMCQSCWNAAVGGAWRPITFPAEREAIEAVLLARPLHTNRNWFPHETVDDLRAENVAHGCPLPEGGKR